MRSIAPLLSVVLVVGPAYADIVNLNRELHHAIWPAHEQKLIVAGTIEAIRTDPKNPYHPEIDIGFSVHDVILGDQKYKGHRFTFCVTSFIWPKDLVLFSEGTDCILVLGAWRSKEVEAHYICTVVPRSKNPLAVAKDCDGAKRILEKEILAELMAEKRPERQRALLLQVAPILTEDDARDVVPFVESEDPRVMRAALSALIYATEDRRYLQMAAEDVQRSLQTKSPDLIARDTFPPEDLFTYYFFLAKRSWTWGSRWNDDEARKHFRILNAMFDTGFITDAVKKVLNPEGEAALEKKW